MFFAKLNLWVCQIDKGLFFHGVVIVMNKDMTTKVKEETKNFDKPREEEEEDEEEEG